MPTRAGESSPCSMPNMQNNASGCVERTSLIVSCLGDLLKSEILRAQEIRCAHEQWWHLTRFPSTPLKRLSKHPSWRRSAQKHQSHIHRLDLLRIPDSIIIASESSIHLTVGSVFFCACAITSTVRAAVPPFVIKLLHRATKIINGRADRQRY